MRKKFFILLCALPGVGCHPEREQYRTDLSSPDPVKRAQAAQGLAYGGDKGDLGYLVAHVGDPDPLVRSAIAEGLGHVDDYASADALAELVGDINEGVQLQAVAALGKLKTSRAKGYLLVAYRRSGSPVRARVAEVLSAAGTSPAEAVQAEARSLFDEYMRDLSGSGAARLTAAEQLGRSGRPEAIERLTEYLAAESHPLAGAAARGLASSGAPEARAALESMLSGEDAEPDLQIAGAQSLGVLGDPAAAPALVRTIQRGGPAANAALTSLLMLAQRSSEAGKQLCAAALVADPGMAARAGLALRGLGLRCAADPFVAKLRRGSSSGLEVASALSAVAEIWRVDPHPRAKALPADAGSAHREGDDDSGDEAAAPSSPFAKPIADLLKYGTGDARAFAALAAVALNLQDLRGDLAKVRKEAESQVAKARERWVAGALPQKFAAGYGDPMGASDGLNDANPAQLEKLLGKLNARGLGLPAEDPAKLPSLFSPDPSSALGLWVAASLGEVRFDPAQAGARAAALRADPAGVARRAAVDAVAYLPTSEQWAALAPLLDDSNPAVREAAVTAAGELDPHVHEAGAWLLDRLKATTPSPDAPLGALVEALGKHPEVAGADKVLAGKLEDPEAATDAARALAALGTGEAKAAILSALKGHRGAALETLLAAEATLGDPAAVEVCKPLLFHVRPEVRAQAVRTLFALEGEKARPQVSVLTQDYDRRVREAVMGR